MLNSEMDTLYICVMANKLPIEKQIQILRLLMEGSSLRSISHICDCSINTVIKLLVEVGRACESFHEQTVVCIKSNKIKFDEIWSFSHIKEKNVNKDIKKNAGDIWTWTAIDADSKLIVSWLISHRNADLANVFMNDVAGRLINRVQLTTVGYRPYLISIDNSLGSNVDFAQLIKIYGAPTEENATEIKHNPVEYTGITKNVTNFNPNETYISKNYLERQNLPVRTHMDRFVILTNVLSKKIENYCLTIALHFVYYNFIKIHKSLKVTPAMQAGLIEKPMTLTDLINLTDAYNKLAKKGNCE